MILSTYDDKKNECNICHKEFKFKCLLRRHKMAHTGVKPFSCIICNKEFLRKHDLHRHVLTHSRRKSLHCKLCDQTFAWKKDLNAHGCSRPSRMTFTCEFCSLTFVRKHYFKDHVLTQCGTKPLHCDICGNKYLSTLYMERHKLSHSNKNTVYRLSRCCTWESEINLGIYYSTDIATYLFGVNVEKLNGKKEELLTFEDPTMKPGPLDEDTEIDIFSSYNEMTFVKVEEPDTVIENNDMLDRNNGMYFSKNEEAYRLEIILPSDDHCLTTVNTYNEPIEHNIATTAHDIERKYPCKVCNKKFKYKSKLEIHSTTHSETKPFSCDKCHKNFRRKGYLLRHNCRSMKEPLSCDICSLTFVRKDCFEDHMLTECGMKPLSCGICGMKYVSTLYLERHMLNHIASR